MSANAICTKALLSASAYYAYFLAYTCMGAPAGLWLSYNHDLAILLSILGEFLVSSCRLGSIQVALPSGLRGQP
eukprot:3697901-Rhodomonas_salina.2